MPSLRTRVASIVSAASATFTAAYEAKLNGIQAGATVNSSDATLLSRANHTGSQAASTISDFTEASQDVVGAMVAAAGGSYNDGAGTITLPGGGASPYSTVEVNLGSFPRKTGRFTISGSGLTAGKPVQIWQAVGPYTGKGTREDEVEMDMVKATGIVLNTTTITVYWNSPTRVRGNRKFAYQVGA